LAELSRVINLSLTFLYRQNASSRHHIATPRPEKHGTRDGPTKLLPRKYTPEPRTRLRYLILRRPALAPFRRRFLSFCLISPEMITITKLCSLCESLCVCVLLCASLWSNKRGTERYRGLQRDREVQRPEKCNSLADSLIDWPLPAMTNAMRRESL
jgi:hypothetical protein